MKPRTDMKLGQLALAATCGFWFGALGLGPSLAAARDTDVHTFPITIVDNRIFVDVKLDGTGRYKFILDSGGGRGAVLDAALFRRLGLVSTAESQERGAGESTQRALHGTLKALAVDDFRIPNLSVIGLDLAPLAGVIGFPQLDGVLGDDLFRRYVVYVNYQRNELQIESPRHFRIPRGGLVVPIRLYQNFIPVATGSVDGIPGSIAIDLGDRSALTLFGPFWMAHRIDEVDGPAYDAMTGYGIGGPINAKLTRVRELKFGQISVANPVTRLSLQQRGAFADSKIAGSVGGAILSRFEVIFDYPHGRIILIPRPDAPEQATDRSGAWFAADASGIYVYAVAPGTPAAEAGLQVRDRVVEINGVASGAFDVFELRGLASDLRTDELALVVGRSGSRLGKTLRLRDLIPGAR
jgi:PDZ domain/Aspartyl protease